MIHAPTVLENETHKILWDFDIQTYQLISARKPNLMIISNNNNKKKENLYSGLYRPSGPQIEN